MRRNRLSGEGSFPSSQRRGGCAINKKARSYLISRRRGGAKREPDRAKPHKKFGATFRRSDHPVRSFQRWLRYIFIDVASTPPLRGGECLIILPLLLLCLTSCRQYMA